MNRWSALAAPIAVLLIFAGALAFRLPKLDIRPLHNDEAVNAVKAAELWQDHQYRYDPDEYHGPTLHYATLPFLSLSSAKGSDDLKDQTLRLAPVIFGAGLVLLLLLFHDAIGRHAMAWAALFLAISPAMVFYSRYFIHETFLVFFTALTLGAAWRYTQSRSRFWALMTGVAVGLMFATKETFALSLAAMGAAGLLTVSSSMPRVAFAGSFRSFLAARWRDVTLALVGTLVVWLLFFSSFFTNFHGLLDSVLTYFPWLKRASGHSPHLHPWYFYLQRLGWFHPVRGPAWSEGLILVLAAIGAVVSFVGKRPFLRFLALYTVILTALYSAITYKTPWCLLNFFLGMILLAGVGAAAVIENFRSRPVKIGIAALLLVLAAQLSWQSWRASFVYSSDRRNPYVYAQTVPDILNLVQRAEGLARVSPAGFETILKVIAPDSDYWPLPWYLRRFKNIGWYESLPNEPLAPIMIVSANLAAQLDEKSERKWIMAGITELRPGKFFELYVELERWKKYVETLPPPAD